MELEQEEEEEVVGVGLHHPLDLVGGGVGESHARATTAAEASGLAPEGALLLPPPCCAAAA